MKLKNISVGDSVSIKKSMCHIEFKAKQVCEVIDTDPNDKYGFDVLIQGKNCLDWVNHKDLKKYIDIEAEPKPKQLDQSVFDGLDSDYMFAAIDGCTRRAYAYEQKPHIPVGKDYWRVHDGMQHPVEHGYDTTNWQNSLIERDKVELTGSDLCRAMLARGDKYVLSDVGGGHNVQVIGGWTEHGFTSRTNQFCLFRNPIPINNQGEPLTASEVGL